MHPLRERSRAALKDPVVQRAVPVATRRAHEKQLAAWAGFDRVEAHRDQGQRIRRHALSHLDDYLEQFEENATARGMRVHWASTREEAQQIVARVVQQAEARLVVKGKSMVSEELALLEHLQGLGLEVWETDLGQLIVQLSGRPPSHLTAPAIHEDAKSVQAIFQRELGLDVAADPHALSMAARVMLREKFLGADVGITGANLLVAGSGRVVLVENEGNIALSTLLPSVHVVVAGIEKVVPEEDDVPVLLELLARSATGQKLTTYTHWIDGPGKDAASPQEVHVVLVDAGRSRMLAEQKARAALDCIRCGACLNVCPVYQGVGGHAYGGVYPGPIGAVTWPWLQPDGDSARLPMASTLCGACVEVCPVKVPIPEMLLHLRAKAVQERSLSGSSWERYFVRGFAWSMGGPRRMESMRAGSRVLLAPLSRKERVKRLPVPVSGWTMWRWFPRPAGRSFRSLWRQRSKTKEGA
jgi:L-lactate dehydrogenase complex protein LldF